MNAASNKEAMMTVRRSHTRTRSDLCPFCTGTADWIVTIYVLAPLIIEDIVLASFDVRDHIDNVLSPS